MCTTCGCGDESGPRVTALSGGESTTGNAHHHAGAAHEHSHGGADQHAAAGHPHSHGGADHHTPTTTPTTTIDIEQRVLAKNDALAAHNRAELSARGISTVNLMSSPGSGKTSLLVRTIDDLAVHRRLAVIEGDQETLLDAERIRATGCEVVQINTGAGCHLDADMLRRGLDALDPPTGSLLFVENVGNLVCPALFDLGETAKVVVISVTEGDDKPLKYPHMFAAADLVVVNKTDLLPFVDFDVEACASRARSLNPGLRILALSVKTGDGLDGWYSWLEELSVAGGERLAASIPAPAATPAPTRSTDA
ncbi:MAG: hydrogenase nickel incorporation protein HypB [Nocardioidaceae bacterium]|nr:hydrogenase nickel incorporation protein HypB [Nocardioidaceae bacterium]